MTDRDAPLVVAFMAAGTAFGLGLGLLPVPTVGVAVICGLLILLAVGLFALWRRG